MKVVNKEQLKELLNRNPNGGIVFAESSINGIISSVIHVSAGTFGAYDLTPDAEYLDIDAWDWNIDEYQKDEHFVVFDNNDILGMIQILTTNLTINHELDFLG